MKKEILSTISSERSVGELSIVIENRSDLGLVVSSRVIANQLGKRHADVLESLTNIVKSSTTDISALLIESNYKASNGKMNREILLTKDGFTLYMFNIQGYNDFKLAYINKFNEMEQLLAENKNDEDKLLLNIIKSNTVESRAIALNDYVQKVVEPLKVENTQMKPKAEYFDALVDRNLLTNSRDTAKEFGIKQNDFIKFLIDRKYIFRDKKNKLKPYSHYMDLFELKEWKTGDKTGVQTLITPRGRETFRLLLNR